MLVYPGNNYCCDDSEECVLNLDHISLFKSVLFLMHHQYFDFQSKYLKFCSQILILIILQNLAKFFLLRYELDEQSNSPVFELKEIAELHKLYRSHRKTVEMENLNEVKLYKFTNFHS